MANPDKLPALIAKLHELPFDYDDGNGIDFEPYDKFMSAKETREWIRAWTGNERIDGAEYRVFGQDGTGGYAAIWRVDPEGDLLAQPIVFFGSEGEVGVVAKSFGEYLWLLAGNIGPKEAIEHGVSDEETANAGFAEFAAAHALAAKRTPTEIFEAAKAAYPSFEADIRKLCR